MMNIRKMLVIFMVFTAVAFAYVLISLNKVTKNVSKIEAFSAEPTPSKDAVTTTTTTVSSTDKKVTPPRLNPTDFGRTEADVAAPAIVKPDVATAVATPVTTPMLSAPTRVVAATTSSPLVTTAPAQAITSGVALSSALPIETVAQVVPVQVPARTVQEVVPTTTTTVIPTPLNTSPLIRERHVTVRTQPSMELPIVDDEERRFWIGNVLYNLMPNNGMAKFMNDVTRLSDKLRYDSFGTIVQNLRDYVANNHARDERVMHELARTLRDIKHGYRGHASEVGRIRSPWDNGYALPGYMALDSPMAGGFYDRHVPTTWRGNGFLFPADHVEMFTSEEPKDKEKALPGESPSPSSYVREYGMHDTWAQFAPLDSR